MIDPIEVMITGGGGFVGSHLIQQLAQLEKVSVIGVVRDRSHSIGPNLLEIGDINDTTNWSALLKRKQVVIHTAARTHIMHDSATDPLTEFRKVNVGGTLNLAQQAAEAGIQRFIFISSIKVNGEQTPLGQPFTAGDNPSPDDAYGISKMEAEQGLRQIAAETGMEIVIIRPPLVYGPGVKGNFASMIRLIEKGYPLPLGAIYNQRSLVGLDNLIDLIITCIDHPAAANQIFLAGDGEEVSTSELLRRVAHAMGKRAWLIPIPAEVLQLGATLLGKKEVAQRLLGGLQVDTSKTTHLLGWTPPLSVDEGLRRCFVKYKD